MINDTPPVNRNNNDDDVLPAKKNQNQKTNNIGKGFFENSDTVKYRVAENDSIHEKKLNVTKPSIDKPLSIPQENNFNESKNIINDSKDFFNKIQETAKSFKDEVKTRKISENTRKELNNNILLLQNTIKYMAYLSGNNVSNNEGKNIIFTGMGLNANQQESAKALLNKNQTLSYINQKHGGEDSVANKIKVLVDSGFNKQQAVSILALSPSKNSEAMLKETDQGKILKALGFDKEQIKNVVNLNKESKYPLQKQLLNKMGFDNDTTKILQALTNQESLKSQEVMIKSSTSEAIWFLDKTIEKFDALKKPAFKREGFNYSIANLHAMLSELSRMLAKSTLTERNTKFDMNIAGVEQKKVQAEKIKEEGEQAFIGELAAQGATIVASAVQVRMISTAPPATVNAVSIKAQAIGSSITASAGIGKAFMNYEAAKTRAEQKESEAKEQLYNTYANEIGEFISNKRAELNKLQNTISDIEKSNANINRTLVV